MHWQPANFTSGLAHVESGLRSFNKAMPEEINRIVADHCADLLFCPTRTGLTNLQKEGIVLGVHLVGDTMVDALMMFIEIAENKSNVLTVLDIKPKEYYLATVHRPYNVDIPRNLHQIISAFQELDHKVVFPIHPRTRLKLEDFFGSSPTQSGGNMMLTDPVGYLDMLLLEKNARMILTDSGGVQKEAFIFGVPCITLRPETEWVETVSSGWNVLTGAAKNKIIKAACDANPPEKQGNLFGDGNAAGKIVNTIERTQNRSI